MDLKFLKRKKVFKKKDFRINPLIYWRIILVFFSALTALSFFFGYYTFSHIDQDLTFPMESISSKLEKEKINKIDSALEYFSHRERKSNEILNAPSLVIDPSL